MSTSELDRLAEDLATPRIVQLHFALARLKSCISFMCSGAHPDDETSAMLAALSLRDGIDISYACANRGEGGQNDIGTQAGEVLGTLRTAEMEKAAQMLNMRLYWLSTHPGDTIFDFGFSKSGNETLSRWGQQRTLERLVTIIRQEKPDILCPTFLDVPGQHGHHRAMTAVALQAFDFAADPEFDQSPGQPWQIAKLYLPAWGGGGSAYDDEVPPPPQTLLFQAKGRDPITGWSYENIGQQSRRYHLTQGMGRWVKAGDERDWPLHLARSTTDTADTSLVSGLPATLEQLAYSVDHDDLQESLNIAHLHLQKTIDAFPDFSSIYDHSFATLRFIQQARAQLAGYRETTDYSDVNKRLRRKEQQLSNVIALAAGIRVRASCEKIHWRVNDTAQLTINSQRTDNDISAELNITVATESPWSYNAQTCVLSLNDAAPLTDPYPHTWLPDEPSMPCLKVTLTELGTQSSIFQALEVPPLVRSSFSMDIEPAKCLLNTHFDSHRPQSFQTRAIYPLTASASLDIPEAWVVDNTGSTLALTPPAQLPPGLYNIPLTISDISTGSTEGYPAASESIIHYPHIAPRLFSTPASVQILATPIALPDKRIAYIGGGNDRVDHWLKAMGIPVSVLDDEALGNADNLLARLNNIDTLLIGVFAYRMRTGLVALAPAINNWVRSGGHLVTLYHRPWDAWDPETVPPLPLTIGQPSLRYRVTDENALVSHLQPSHRVLNIPNRIEEADWQGWHKERGLYFAKSWHADYQPLLSMADPNEDPHEGSLLCASVGKGQHIHTSLILHHQMENLTPGAFRLMANLLD